MVQAFTMKKETLLGYILLNYIMFIRSVSLKENETAKLFWSICYSDRTQNYLLSNVDCHCVFLILFHC